MGSPKGRRQEAAETRSKGAVEQEQQQAEGLRTELTKRRAVIGEELPESMAATRTGAMNLRETGGFNPGEIDPIKKSYGEFAETGGFSTEDKEQFLRRSTAPVAAMYSRAQDELNRRAAVQGGYQPGFEESQSRLLRQASQGGAEASLEANVELANQVRQGKLAGTGGLERVAQTVQAGKIAGQDALQRYIQFGVAGLSDVDTTELRNRLQTGQMSQADAELLVQIAAQNKTLFENIMQGVSAVGGATAGILGAI